MKNGNVAVFERRRCNICRHICAACGTHPLWVRT